MKYIAIIHTTTGHRYIGPDTDLQSIIRETKIDVEDASLGITDAWVHEYDEATDNPNTDKDPIWSWMLETNPIKKIAHYLVEELENYRPESPYAPKYM